MRRGWLTELWSLVPSLTMNKCSRKTKQNSPSSEVILHIKGTAGPVFSPGSWQHQLKKQSRHNRQAASAPEGGRTLLHHLCALTSRHCGISLDCAYVLCLSSWGSSLLTWRQSGMGIQVLKHNSTLHVLFLPVVKMFHVIWKFPFYSSITIGYVSHRIVCKYFHCPVVRCNTNWASVSLCGKYGIGLIKF